jgi:DNA-binding PadR family transcriptional regulator
MARLLVLWLLAERQLTGYEIKKALSDEGMKFWFGLEDASIYSTLRTLTKHGHAQIVGTEQQGNRPARTRYRITNEGRRYYRGLLTHVLAVPSLPIAPIDVVLAASGDLEPTTVSEALARRSKALHELAAQIAELAAAAPSPTIADRNLCMVAAEIAWLNSLDQRRIT